MVVDFAVEDDGVAAIGREDRLMSAGDVDDAQAAHTETEIAVGQRAAVVRATVDHSVALPHDHFGWDGASRSSVPSRDATHCTIPRCHT
jgi:hypothetical protein